VHFASAISTVLVLYGLYAFTGRGVTVTVSQSIVLQVCHRFPPLFLVISHHHNQLLGILLAKAALLHPSQSHLAPSLILLAVVVTSACNVLIIDNVPFTSSLLAWALMALVDLPSSCSSVRQKAEHSLVLIWIGSSSLYLLSSSNLYPFFSRDIYTRLVLATFMYARHKSGT
jgi:hypothetical protein